MSGYDRASLTVVIDSVQAATLDKSPKPAVNVQPVQNDSEEGWVE